MISGVSNTLNIFESENSNNWRVDTRHTHLRWVPAQITFSAGTPIVAAGLMGTCINCSLSIDTVVNAKEETIKSNGALDWTDLGVRRRMIPVGTFIIGNFYLFYYLILFI